MVQLHRGQVEGLAVFPTIRQLLLLLGPLLDPPAPVPRCAEKNAIKRAEAWGTKSIKSIKGGMPSKHVTDKTNEDNEGCMLRAHTCLCFQLENNEAHLARLLRLPLLQRSISLQPLLTLVGVQRGGHFVRRGPLGQRGRRRERGERSKRTSRSTGGSTEADHGKRGQRSERWKQRQRQHAKCFSP